MTTDIDLLDDREAIVEAVEKMADAEVLLELGGALREMLFMARERAVRAVAKLAECNPDDASQIRVWQQEIRVYRLYCDDIRTIFAEGEDALEQMEGDAELATDIIQRGEPKERD